jgi:hypothetical protein
MSVKGYVSRIWPDIWDNFSQAEIYQNKGGYGRGGLPRIIPVIILPAEDWERIRELLSKAHDDVLLGSREHLNKAMAILEGWR